MTNEQIKAAFHAFRIRVWQKASSPTVAGRVEVWREDSDLLAEVAKLLASLPPEEVGGS